MELDSVVFVALPESWEAFIAGSNEYSPFIWSPFGLFPLVLVTLIISG